MNTIDSARVYCTNAIIKPVGRSVAVSLEDATLPGKARNKHMVVLFRKGKKWTVNEVESISRDTRDWIKKKYGHNNAPITFTVDHWGKHSVKIEGDLNGLCLYLRSNFAVLSNDKQRIPHCKLFVHKRDNCCHICGEYGHKKRFCPQKKEKKNGKIKSMNIAHKNGTKRPKHKGKERLQRIISKIDQLRTEKEKEIELLNEEQQILTQLLNNADDVDDKALRNQIKNITKSFKNKRKEYSKHKATKRGRKSNMNDDYKEEDWTLNGDEETLYGDESEDSLDQIEGAQNTMDIECTQKK